MKRNKLTFTALIALIFTIALFVCVLAPTTVAFADDGSSAETATEAVEPSNGEKVRNWIYEKGDALVAGISSSALIGAICGVALAVIKKKLVNKLADNGSEQKITLSEVKEVLNEAKAIRAAVESDVERLKALKHTEAVEAVESKANDIIDEIDSLDEAEDEAVMRS